MVQVCWAESGSGVFTGHLVWELQLKVKGKAPLGLLPTLEGPNSTNPACGRGRNPHQSLISPFINVIFGFASVCSINKSREKNTAEQTYFIELLNAFIKVLKVFFLTKEHPYHYVTGLFLKFVVLMFLATIKT